MNETYWAAELKSDECVRRFFAKRRRYLKRLQLTGRAERMSSSWSQYYGWGHDGQRDTVRMKPTGERGELVDMATNDFAVLVQQATTMLTASPPVFKAITSNTDTKSRASAELADGLCEYYDKHGALQDREIDTVRAAQLASEAWLVLGWDFCAGREYTREQQTGAVVKEGDVSFHSFPPWDVCYDGDAQDIDSLPWFAFRARRNRHDLIARVLVRGRKDLAEELLKATAADGEGRENSVWDLRINAQGEDFEESDFIHVWEIRHPPSDAVPNGRLLRFVNDNCILFDSLQADGDELALYNDSPAPQADVATGEQQSVKDFGYPFGTQLLAFPLAPERVIGGLDGHSSSVFDSLSLQQGFDSAASAMATALNAGALSNWWLPEGGDVPIDELAGGLNIIKSKMEPKVIQGAQVDPQAPAFAEFVLEMMRRKFGFNAAALGEPTKGMPAQLAALLQAQAVQFYSGLQRNVYGMQARARSGLIWLLRHFARTKRVALIAGRNAGWKVREWESTELEGVERVSFEPLNPVMRTQAGRVDFADKLLKGGEIDGTQYLTVVTTGRLEATWDSKTSNLARIQREKELLQQGVGLPPAQVGPDGVPVIGPGGKPAMQPPQPGAKPFIRPLYTDTHWLDIPECLSVLATPEARNDPNITRAVLEVVEYKMQLLRDMDPMLVALLGGPADLVARAQDMAAASMGMPPGGPGGPGGPPPPGGDQAGQVATPHGGPHVRPVKQPRPPPNPITGEKQPAPLEAV